MPEFMEALLLAVAISITFFSQPSLAITCNSDEIRLSDGRTEYEGRLEVCEDGMWGTVCNNLWTTESTSVVCKQLGIGERGYYTNRLPQGTGPILLANVQCNGTESEIMKCPYVRTQNCSHTEDVRIVCIPADTPPECEDGSLRLEDGNSPHDGRLEVCQAGVWGTICTYLWDRNDGMVACRQLGINATAAYVGLHNEGSGPIFLSGVTCNGDEDEITDCPSDPEFHYENCTHSFDVTLLCSVLTEPECAEGELRLVDGRSEHEGRLEVCQDGVWGTVCDDGWRPQTSGMVACRQLGFESEGALFGTFGEGIGPTHLAFVWCTGAEQSIFNCFHFSSRDHNLNCYPSEPVGLICPTNNEIAECDGNAIRLVDSSGALTEEGNGMVEMCVNQKWARACDSLWDRKEAEVVCKQLGFSSSHVIGYLVDDTYTGQVVTTTCENNETTLFDCISSNYGCFEQKYGAVICNSTGTECKDGDLRLANLSEVAFGGRLEMCFLGVWGTVCDDGWLVSNAIVACRELGYEAEGATFINHYVPRGQGPIMLDNLRCTGGEKSLIECTHNQINRHDCSGLENVGLYCQEPPNLTTSPTTTKNSSRTTTAVQLSATPPLSSSPTPVIVGVIGAAVVLLLLVLVALVATCTIRRRRFRRRRAKRITLSSVNPQYATNMDIREFATDGMSNEYDSGTGTMKSQVSLRTNKLGLPVSSKVRGSFIRQLTEDFIIPLKNLTLLVKIGEGEFGIVYKATLSDNGMEEDVAVKTLKGVYSQDEVDSMLEEGLKLKHFQHQNVLNLIGVCVEATPAPYIVMPFMSNGSLLTYLRTEKSSLVLNDLADEEIVGEVNKRLTTMCQQISKGMKYLASEKFVHRDLATRNCMIDENYVIKIADFGLSEDIYSKTYFRQQSHTSVKLPVKWMALESLQEGVFSEKTDVWSFGVTCWEVFSGGKNPYPGVSPMGVIEVLERGERMAQPNNAACTKRMYELMRLCWQQDPTRRPTFARINELIDKCLEELAGYVNMEGCLFPEIQLQLNGEELGNKF